MPAWTLAATLGAGVAFANPIRADLHLDTPTQLLAKDLPLDAPTGLESGLVQMQAGGTNLAVMVLWPPRNTDHRVHATALLDRLTAEVDRIPAVEMATDPAQAQRVVDASRVAVLVSMEGAHGLGDGPWEPVFDDFVARGLRMMGLTWSFSNRFAGSSGDSGGGLTKAGSDLVERSRRQGILIDVSHASRATTLAVCAGAAAPVVASHSNAHALAPTERNLTDAEIRCIAKTGGVIGLNFHAPFVGKGANVSGVADHADHIASVGGHSAVALGSDFDGYIRTPDGLDDASHLEALWTELEKRGWTEAQMRGVQGDNFMRAWRGAWAARRQ